MGGTPMENVEYEPRHAEPTQPAALDINPKVTASGLAGAFCIALFALLAENGIDVSVTTVTASTTFLTLLAGYLMPNGRHNN